MKVVQKLHFFFCDMAASSKNFDSLFRVLNEEEDAEEAIRKVKKVNEYILVKKIGSGSFSNVYFAFDANNNEYAVKRINLKDLCRTTSGVAQLEREVRLMQLFEHPNILKIKEVLNADEKHHVYLVLEYAKKGCLGSFIERGQRLNDGCIFSIMKQVVLALKYLHEKGYVHQDVKPGNILLDENGRAILADFGIGHSFQSAQMVIGSPAFQAPECLDDYSMSDEEFEEDESSQSDSLPDLCPQKEDVWSLGVTLYQLLFMKLPYEGGNLFEIVSNIKSKPLTFPEGTDEEIVKLISGMLTIDQTQRFGIDDVLSCHLIANASDLAVDLPEVPSIEHIDINESTQFEQIEAEVCPKGYSFANVALSIQRRLSFINAPYSSQTCPEEDEAEKMIYIEELNKKYNYNDHDECEENIIQSGEKRSSENDPIQANYHASFKNFDEITPRALPVLSMVNKKVPISCGPSLFP